MTNNKASEGRTRYEVVPVESEQEITTAVGPVAKMVKVFEVHRNGKPISAHATRAEAEEAAGTYRDEDKRSAERVVVKENVGRLRTKLRAYLDHPALEHRDQETLARACDLLAAVVE